MAGAIGRQLRSVGAVFAGFVTVVLLSVATDVVLHVTHVYPPPDQPMLTTRALGKRALAERRR